MNNYSKLYWLTRLDTVNGIFLFFFILSTAMLLFSVLGYLIAGCDEYQEAEKIKAKERFKKTFGFMRPLSFWLLPIFALLMIFTPTQKEVILIMAGGKTMDFIQTDSSVNKIPSQTTAIISTFLDNQIKELKK